MKAMRIFMAALVSAMFLGTSGAFAGGSSDTTGEGYHCYQFFTLPKGFAQTMVNDEKPKEVQKKMDEFYEKYVDKEGGELSAVIGNVAGCADDSCPCWSKADLDMLSKKASCVRGVSSQPDKCFFIDLAGKAGIFDVVDPSLSRLGYCQRDNGTRVDFGDLEEQEACRVSLEEAISRLGIKCTSKKYKCKK